MEYHVLIEKITKYEKEYKNLKNLLEIKDSKILNLE